MALKADRDGFLTGEPITIDRDAFAKAVNIWKAIRGDTAALRKSLLGDLGRLTRSAISSPRSAANSPVFSDKQAATIGAQIATAMGKRKVSATVRARGADGRFISATVSPAGETATPAAAKRSAPELNRTRSRTAVPERGANGRFLGNGNDGGSSGGAGFAMSGLTDATVNLKDTAAGLAQTAEAVDPTVTAAKELGEIVSPVLRPVGGLLKKGFGALFRRNDSVKEKEEKKRQKENVGWFKKIHKSIEETGGRDGSGGGLLSTLLKGASALGGGLISGAGGLLGGLLGGAGRLIGKGGLGGILGKALLPIGAMFSAHKSFNTSTEDYAARMGVELNGSLAQELGVRFAGVLGDLGNTLTFGLAGKFGEVIAPHVGTMVDKIAAGWDASRDWLKVRWGETIGLWDGTAKKVESGWTTVTDWLGQKVGVVKEKVVEVTTTVQEKVGSAWESTKELAGKAAEGIRNRFNRVIEAGKGYNVIQREDGTIERQEGARNWRNNNPGNIEFGDFAKKHGAIGSDGRFAVFPSYEAGRSAKESLIFEGKNYRNKSLTEAIARYAPPGENNTAMYQQRVLAAVGGANKPMSAYTTEERAKIMDAMEKVEGFRVGKTATLQAGSIPMRQVATVSARTSMPILSSMAPLPSQAPAPAPAIQTPIGSNGKGDGRTEVKLTAPISQNLSDRGIAHVATGGIGGV